MIRRLWKTRPLPSIQQGSTLSVISTVPNTNLTIQSHWNDEGSVSMSQRLIKDSGLSMMRKTGLKILQQVDQVTSLGRSAPHLSVAVENLIESEKDGHSSGGDVIAHDDEEHLVNVDMSTEKLSENFLEIYVPEKINLHCDLQQGGAISIPKKIEGDVHLVTNQGPIHVQKLRGHDIHIEAKGSNDSVFASDLLEAQTLNIKVADGRLRAKRIHANTVDIGIHSSSAPESTLLDADDSTALCDISSFYLSGDANITVDTSYPDCRPVRIKSHHGAVTVNAVSPKPSLMNQMTGETVPIVELGGVNGSCEVFVKEIKKDAGEEESKDWVSCQVHFDSISPDSVSIVKADHGNVNITVDRKVESDMRFISASEISSIDIDTIVGDENEEEDMEDLFGALQELDQKSSRTRGTGDDITINTKSFTPKDNFVSQHQDWKNISVVDGWVENKSAEPDSRFDRKLRGEGGGKIRLDGAAAQALHGFNKKESPETEEDDQFLRPLVVVAASKRITLETLSWLGNIARRYGMDDSRDKEDLGRTATRRGRSLET